MQELFLPYHGYSVGDHGTIIGKQGKELKPRWNGNKTCLNVGFYHNGTQHNLNVGAMVLRAFVSDPPLDFSGREYHCCHLDDDPTNNCLSNLRWGSCSSNAGDKNKGNNQSSKYHGIHWDRKRKRWRARVKLKGKKQHIANSKDELEAALAFDAFVRALPELRDCVRNFPQGVENTVYVDDNYALSCFNSEPSY